MASREQDPEAVFIEFISSDIDWSLMRAMYKPVTLSHKSGRYAADMNNPPRMPSRSQFVVKVCVVQSSMFVSNEEGSVHGSLYRKAGQEEVYDMLRRQIGARGFERRKAFFSAIYKSDTYEEGCKLEINRPHSPQPFG